MLLMFFPGILTLIPPWIYTTMPPLKTLTSQIFFREFFFEFKIFFPGGLPEFFIWFPQFSSGDPDVFIYLL